MKIVAFLGMVLFVVAAAAAQTSLNWPETIELLAQQRTQAETCVDTLKSGSDKAAVATSQLTYRTAKSQSDGVIDGLTVALVQGSEPDALPAALAVLKRRAAGFKKSATPR